MASKLLECASIPARGIERVGIRYTRSLCCLFGRSACTVSARECTAMSRRAFFHNEDAQARVPRGSGAAVVEAQRGLQSWGSQMDLSAELETDTVLYLPSPDRFSASSQGWEARAAVSSASIEAQTLSDSEELYDVSVNARDTEDSPPLVLMRSLLRL